MGVIRLSARNRDDMPIIDILKEEKKENVQEGVFSAGDPLSMIAEAEKVPFSWEPFFSSVCARLFFLLLIVFDGLWFSYLIFKMSIYSLLQLGFMGSSSSLQARLVKNWVSLKRSLICALSLFVALFSPAFGIMIGCTYFLMYDKAGIEEVVPASLRSQFKELFSACSQNDV